MFSVVTERGRVEDRIQQFTRFSRNAILPGMY
jgi:hypothetical protein